MKQTFVLTLAITGLLAVALLNRPTQIVGQAQVPHAESAVEESTTISRDSSQAIAAHNMGDSSQAITLVLSQGSIAQVLSALPRLAENLEDASKIAEQQAALCRFENDSANELGFEILKFKFQLLFGKREGFKPWNTVCSS